MIITFSFAFNPETKEGTFAGTCEPMVALQILQNIIIAQAIQESKKKEEQQGAGQDKVKPVIIEQYGQQDAPSDRVN